jgi:thioredoxin-related protein
LVIFETGRMKMKVRNLIVAVAFLFTASPTRISAEDKPQPQWKTLDEGIQLANQAGKKVLIDVYATWCKWCKRMDAEVYSDSTVISYIHQNFIPIKMDAESEIQHQVDDSVYTEREIAKKFGVKSFPATMFIESTGVPITLFPGFHEKNEFLQFLKYIAEDHFKKMKFAEYLAKQTKQKPKTSGPTTAK